MSVFIIPTHESRHHHRPSATSYGRCGPSSSSFDPFLGRHNAIPRGFLGALLADDDDEEEDDTQGYIQLNPWQEHVERLRRQEYLQEVQRRQRVLQARRQQQQQLLELERERERQRAQRERLARIAWHREQQQRAAAQEYQCRLEAYRRRQQQEYAERVRLAKAYEHDWEQVATEAVFGMINLAQQLFGGDEEEKKEAEKETVATTSAKKPQAEQDKQGDEMQVDQAEDKEAPVAQPQATQTNEQVEQVATEAKPAEEQNATTEQAEQVGEESAATSTDRLIFTYPLPADESIRSSIQAKDIHVKFDQASRTIQLSGLWHNDAPSDDASSTVGSDNGDDQARGRKRSRSPKRSRVSDVDEKTGEEISTQDEDEDYVEVTDNTNKSPVSKTLPLPEDVSAQGLRAEITDDGFQVWVH